MPRSNRPYRQMMACVVLTAVVAVWFAGAARLFGSGLCPNTTNSDIWCPLANSAPCHGRSENGCKASLGVYLRKEAFGTKYSEGFAAYLTALQRRCYEEYECEWGWAERCYKPEGADPYYFAEAPVYSWLSCDW